MSCWVSKMNTPFEAFGAVFLFSAPFSFWTLMNCHFNTWIVWLILGQTIVPSILQLSAMAVQMLAISLVMSLISALVS